jgi:hypothetical protein
MKSEKSKSMRIVAEPSAPLDAEGELLLDAELTAMARQLQDESGRLVQIADGKSPPDRHTSHLPLTDHGELQLDDTLAAIANQLTLQSRQLATTAGASGAVSDLQRSRNVRRKAGLLRLAPFAAAAALVLALVSSPAMLEQVEQRAPSVRLDSGNPSKLPIQEVGVDNSSIPWQQLSSPELEGALDLVDGTVTISI